MLPVMLRDGMRRSTVLLRLRGPVPMMRDRLHALAVLRLDPAARRDFGISKILAHLIPREDFGRHESRADTTIVIAQDKAVNAGFPRYPGFPGRDQHRASRSAGRAAEDKRMDALALKNFHVRH